MSSCPPIACVRACARARVCIVRVHPCREARLKKREEALEANISATDERAQSAEAAEQAAVVASKAAALAADSAEERAQVSFC